jgi:hypothetical protein
MLIFGAYNIYSVNYFSKLSSIITVFSGNQDAGSGKDMNMFPGDGENNFREGLPSGEHPTRDGKGSGRDFPARGEGEGRSCCNMKGPNSTNTFSTLTSYLSIISVFTIITFYIEKLLKIIRLKRAS